MPQCIGTGCDAQLIAVRSDQADLPGADAIVDAVLLAVSRCGAAMAAHSCAMGASPCSVCVSVLDAKPAEPTGTDRPEPGARRHQLPLDLDALATLARGGGQVGVAPTSPQLPQLG